MRSTLLAILAVAYLLVLVDLTLVRFPQPSPEPNLVPLRTIASCWEAGGKSMAVNILGNLALLVPVGVLLPMLRPGRVGPVGVATAGMVLSVGIEAAQLAGGHRMADVDDVLLNTAGAVAGYGACAATLLMVSIGTAWRAMAASGGADHSA